MSYTKIIQEKSVLGYNCVLYARSRKPNLPFGLFTLAQKLHIINSKKPKVGAVAIIDTGQQWGHVAIVTFIGKQHITIQESNWISGKITERHGSESDLNIRGYFI
jgi:hypothetical protein